MGLVLYLSYNDFWPGNVVKFFLFHYVQWLFPLVYSLGLLGVLLVIQQRRLKLLSGMLALGLFPAFLTPELEPLDGSCKADSTQTNNKIVCQLDTLGQLDVLDLTGLIPRSGYLIEVHSFDLNVDGRPLRLFRDYRPIQTATGIQLVANAAIRGSKLELCLPANSDNLEGLDTPILATPQSLRYALTLPEW